MGKGSAVDPYEVGEKVNAYANGVGGLIVDGTGATRDYTDTVKAPWTKDALSIKSATIGDAVTEIGSRFFKKCYNLSRVTCGASVTKFGEKAFLNCSALESISIANPDFDISSLEDSIIYRLAINKEGKFFMIPKVEIMGYTEVIYGKANLTDAEWTKIGPLSNYDSWESLKEAFPNYHFFRAKLEKEQN